VTNAVEILPATEISGTPPGSSDITLLYLIKQVELAIRSHLDVAVREVGLTVVQYTALTVLERRPGLTSAQLAKNSFVRAQTMAQVTTELEARGLVSRRVDSSNQRRLLLSVTDEGQEILDRVLPDVQGIEQQMLTELDVPEVRQLREALHSCRIALGGGRPH
jgi:DNA-binding MarR family transcriptional regulator